MSFIFRQAVRQHTKNERTETMARTGENIYKRKDGRWEARYIFSYNADGKAKYRYLYARTYSDVKAMLIKAQSISAAEAVKNKAANSERYEFWLSEWLRSKKIGIKDSTYIRYKNIIEKHIAPKLGKYPISKISTPLMEKFVSDKLSCGRLDGSGGLSAKTASDILAIVKGSFRYAQASGADTACRFGGITFKKASREMRVLSVCEQQKLLAVLLQGLDRYKLGVFICLYTGIRVGELCALRWKNISLGEKTLTVEHTMQRIQNTNPNVLCKTKIIITEPKSSASRRTIPLPGFVAEVLKPFAASPSAYVLSGESNALIEPRTMQNRFKSYLKEGGICDANFHSLRHTFATRCVEAGFDAKTLSEILGHSSVKITLDRYVHSSMELKRSNMEKLSPAAV